MKRVSYITSGTCSKIINLEVDDENRITNISFVGGCNGNLQGLCALVKGMKAEDVKTCLKGICCGTKLTSCPDQLCHAIEELENK